MIIGSFIWFNISFGGEEVWILEEKLLVTSCFFFYFVSVLSFCVYLWFMISYRFHVFFKSSFLIISMTEQ